MKLFLNLKDYPFKFTEKTLKRPINICLCIYTLYNILNHFAHGLALPLSKLMCLGAVGLRVQCPFDGCTTRIIIIWFHSSIVGSFAVHSLSSSSFISTSSSRFVKNQLFGKESENILLISFDSLLYLFCRRPSLFTIVL